jgi:hypothetical protein
LNLDFFYYLDLRSIICYSIVDSITAVLCILTDFIYTIKNEWLESIVTVLIYAFTSINIEHLDTLQGHLNLGTVATSS